MSNLMSTQDFENYVKQGEAAGVPREQTQAQLQKNGWQIDPPKFQSGFNATPEQFSQATKQGMESPIGKFVGGAAGLVKGLVAPVAKMGLAATSYGFQGADYLSSLAAGKDPNTTATAMPNDIQNIRDQGLDPNNIADSLLTLSPFAGAKFSKVALPYAASKFAIGKYEGKPTGEAASDAAKAYMTTKLLGLAGGPKSMAAIGGGLQAANEIAGGQNPLSPEGLGGIAAAGGLGYLGGKSNLGIEKSSGAKGSGVVGAEAKSLVTQISGLSGESQKVAFDPQTRSLTEGMLSGNTEPSSAVARIHDTLNNLSQDVSDTGKEYSFVRASTQVEPVPIDVNENILKKYGLSFVPEGQAQKSSVLGNPIQGGHLEVDPTGPAARMSPQAIDQIEAFMKFSGGVRTITPEVFKQAKSLLVKTGDFYDPSIPGGGGEIKGLAGELLKTLKGIRDNATTPDFQMYKALDQKYAPKIRLLDELRGFFEPDPATGKMRVKDTSRGKILNALKGNKTNLINDLERQSPGITREIRAYETYQNIVQENKAGQYVRAAAKTAGAGYVLGGTAGGVAGGIAGIFASEPRVVFSALSKIAKVKEFFGIKPEEIIFKVERGMPLTKQESSAIHEVSKSATPAILQEGLGQASLTTVPNTPPNVNTTSPVSQVTPTQRAMADQADNLSQVSVGQQAEAARAVTNPTVDGGVTLAKEAIKNAKIGETITVPIGKNFIVPPKGISEGSFWKRLGKGTTPPEWSSGTSGNIQASIVNGKLEVWDGLHRLNEAVKNGETSIQVTITK